MSGAQTQFRERLTTVGPVVAAAAILVRALRRPLVIGACGVLLAGVVAATVGFVVVRGRDAQPDTAAGSAPRITMSDRSRGVVWAVGDGPDDGPAAKRVAALITAAHPDLVLYLGDVYTADYHAFPAAFDGLAARVAPTPGNHDWPGNAEDGYLRYWKTVEGHPLAGYYAMRTGGWQILSLNSEAPHGSGSAQTAWLRRQVRGSGTCRLAFWHRPRYSAGKHGDQPDMAPLWDALRGHASLVVAGHDHDMQRLVPIDGITEVVSGAGGHSHYHIDRKDDRVAFGDDTHDGALRLTLTPGRAELALVDVDGRALDRSTVACTPAAPGR